MLKYIWLAALLCAPASADVSTIEVPREIQQADEVCWAAVSTMAVNSFGLKIKVKVNDNPDYEIQPLTQQAIIALQQTGVMTAKQLKDNRKAFDDAWDACDPVTDCASVGKPWLYRLASSSIAAGKMLSQDVFAKDIGERKTPIIIQWNYPSDSQAQPDNPQGSHVLIVTGYNPGDSVKTLRVWDPWPTVERAAQRDQPPEREKWISYQQYANPDNDLGAIAEHEGDLFKLRLAGSPAPPGYPKAIDALPQNISAPISIDFDHGIVAVDGIVATAMHDRVVLDREGHRLPGPFTAKSPIPIIALAQSALLRTRERPQELLINRTAAFLVPVYQQGRLVDSFIVRNANGGWSERGYSNDRIAHLLVDLRERMTSAARSAAGFYLVSIPERGSFFIGHGFGSQSVLVSLANDGSGRPEPGEQALKAVLDRIDRNRTGGGGANHRRPPPTGPAN
jgi:hypothetical protein